MSDQDLRALERRFRETESVEDEVAWLRGRVRAGDLAELRLEWAGKLGHAAARLALGMAPGWTCGANCREEPSISRVLHDTGCEHRVDHWVSSLYSFADLGLELRLLLAEGRWMLRQCQICRDPWHLEREELLRSRDEWCSCDELRAAVEEAEADLNAGDEADFAILDGLARAPWGAGLLDRDEEFRSFVVAELLPWALGSSG